MSIEVEILDIESGSSYNDIIYDQWIKVRLPTGENIKLFDDQILLSDESIKKRKRVNLTPVFNTTDISIHSELDYGIEVVDSDSGTEHIYRGKVEQIRSSRKSDDSNEKVVVLNVGYGKVCFQIENLSKTNLQVNDKIAVTAFRSDLSEVDMAN